MDIQIELSRRIRSFASSVLANNLNKFVVLTGRNGAGKTQLLNLLTGNQYSPQNPQGKTTISIDGAEILSSEIVHITTWDMPGAPQSSASELNSYSGQVTAIVAQYMQGSTNLGANYPSFSQRQLDELRQIGTNLISEGLDPYTHTPNFDHDIEPRLSKDFDNHSAEMINERIGRIIYTTHFQAFSDKRDVLAEEDPINIFNKLCTEFDMQFTLPQFTTPIRPYVPILQDSEDNAIDWSELSAGEMVIFRIITWLFYYQQNHTLYPKLLLLDEPDAHLSPRMIRKFIDSIQDVLVDQMGIAVIMTTHSPNTVALTDEATLYELKRAGSNHSIEKITKAFALQTFSEGLIFVQEKTKMIFLEGKADPPFYSKFYEIAVTRYGLTNKPSLNFIAISNDDPDEGGCTKVIAMVQKFSDSIISDLVHGVIDRDKNNTASTNVHVLRRYSIENYLYDPIVIAVALIRNGKHKDTLPTIAHIDTDDVQSVLLNQTLMQSVIDEVLACIAEKIDYELDTTPIEAGAKTKYGDIVYELPRWFIDIKKADLLTGALYKSGQKLSVNKNDQYLALESTAMIHKDLYSLLSELTN